jgi:hypothetical protein
MFVVDKRKWIEKGMVKRKSKIIVYNKQGKRIKKGMVRRKSGIVVCNG